MLGLVAIGSVLTVVYLFVEFVWWSPTTNDRRQTAASGLRKRYKKLRASGAKQHDERGLTSSEQEGASAASLETDPVIPLAIQNSRRNAGAPQATGLSSR